VLEVDRVRIRRAGNKYFADLGVSFSRRVTFQRSQQLASDVRKAVQDVLHNADVTVSSVALATGEESIFDRIHAVAAENNFSVHDVSVQDFGGRLHVEMHLELDEHWTLKEAHDEVTRIETEMKAEILEISSILTHIESEPRTIESGDQIIRDP